MKSFLILALLGFSTFAAAETCESALEHSRRGVERLFTGFGRSYADACMDAQAQCKRALSTTRDPMLSCRITSMGPTPPRPPRPTPIPGPIPPRGENCVANLKDRAGRTIDRFVGISVARRFACEDALNKCQRDLDLRHRDGRNPYAYCEVERGFDNDPFPTYFGSCSVEKVDRLSYIVQRFFATANGYSQFEAQESACRDAESQCLRTLYGRHERCRRAAY